MCVSAIKRWVRTDGLLHMLVSALLVVAFGWIRPLWVAPAVAMAIGIAKEIYDKVSGKGTAEWHDIICDIIGIAVGFGLLALNLFIR